MSELVVSQPDLLTVSMTQAEAFDVAAALKRHTISYVNHRKEMVDHERMSAVDREQACELAFRLKENDNYKLLNSEYTSWSDCCKHEFGGPLRQEVDRWVAEHSVNRILPKDERPDPGLQTRVLAQVPDALKAEVYAEAKRRAPTNSFTKQKQLSARVIAEAAQSKGVEIKGLPKDAKPRSESDRQVVHTDRQKAEMLTQELFAIKRRADQLLTYCYEETPRSFLDMLSFVKLLSSDIADRLDLE